MEHREHRRTSVTLLALLLLGLALLGSSHGAKSDGKHSRKIIIHVPYYIKNHHHTHTVFKYVKPKDGDHQGDGAAESQGGGQQAGGGDGDAGASLEQGYAGHGPAGGGSAEAGDNFGDHHEAEFIGHHQGFHDDGEATHNSPQALGLHGEHHAPPLHRDTYAPPGGPHLHDDHLPVAAAPPPVDHHDDHHHPHDDHHHHHHHLDDHHHHHDDHHHHHDDDRRHHHHDQHRYRGTEEDSHLFHREQNDHVGKEESRLVHREHRAQNHHDRERSQEHAHFHTKFVVGASDGQLHETDSSESSEQSAHRDLEPHRKHRPFSLRDHYDHTRYEHDEPSKFDTTDHRGYDSHAHLQNGDTEEMFSQEERYPENPPKYEGYNTLHSEQHTDESKRFSRPSQKRDQVAPYDRFHYEKLEEKSGSKDSRGQRKQKGKQTQERPRSQKYEVKETNQEQSLSRHSHSLHDHTPEYQSTRHRKQNYDWR